MEGWFQVPPLLELRPVLGGECLAPAYLEAQGWLLVDSTVGRAGCLPIPQELMQEMSVSGLRPGPPSVFPARSVDGSSKQSPGEARRAAVPLVRRLVLRAFCERQGLA